MLREHGTQRPSVFELLAQVHRMRGTKSRFAYQIVPQQPLSSRTLQSQSATQLDNLVSYRPPSSTATQRLSPAKNTGIQARDKVLEAIAPMRRGRPSSSQQQDPIVPEMSKPPSPPKIPLETTKPQKVDLLDDHFGVEEDNAWRLMKSSVPSDEGIKASSSSTAATFAWKPKDGARGELDAAWSVESLTSTDSGMHSRGTTFGDNFAENLWNAYDSNRAGSSTLPAEKAAASKIAPLEGSRNTKLIITKGKDAFEGLGLTSSTQSAPTLGEARKLRTGLAAVNAYNRPTVAQSPSSTATKPKPTTASVEPTPSPRPSVSHTSSSWRTGPATQTMSSSISTTPAFPRIGELSPEMRFPPLEELDATMSYSQKPRYTTQAEPNLGNQSIIDLSVPSTSSIPLRPQPQRSVASSTTVQSSTRFEQVTGTPVRETEKTSRPPVRLETGEGISPTKRSSGRPRSRSSLSAKHAVNVSSKPSETQNLLDLTGDSTSAFWAPQKTREYKDWLTGDSDTLASPARDRGASGANPPETPVLREFTHRRSSFVEENNVHIQLPQEAIPSQQSPGHVVQISTPPSPTRGNSRSSRSKERKRGTSLTSSHRNPMLLGRLPPAPPTRTLSITQDSPTTPATRPSSERSSSSGDWKIQPTLDSPREGKMSSSDEETPEDAVGFMASKSVEKSGTRHKGRQSSVHELLDLWGGGVVQTREKRKDVVPNPSTDPIVKSHKSRSIAIPSATKFTTASPQHLQAANSGAIVVPRSPSKSPNRRSPISHTRQMSVVNSTPSTPVTTSRGRPQSLLVFPMSKSTSDGKLDTPVTPSSLSVPQDGSRVGSTRRPSITDMVQRYEAIGKVASPSSLPLSKSAIASGITSMTTGRALQQSLHSPATSKFSPSRVALTFDDLSSAPDPDKRQLPRPSYTGPTDKSADVSRSQSSVSGLPTASSSKPLSLSASQGSIDGLPSAAPPLEGDPRPPSPEKPYQGVGKLIDQWQRKSEEASRSPAPRRGFTTKRAGLVNGGVGRDN